MVFQNLLVSVHFIDINTSWYWTRTNRLLLLITWTFSQQEQRSIRPCTLSALLTGSTDFSLSTISVCCFDRLFCSSACYRAIPVNQMIPTDPQLFSSYFTWPVPSPLSTALLSFSISIGSLALLSIFVFLDKCTAWSLRLVRTAGHSHNSQ